MRTRALISAGLALTASALAAAPAAALNGGTESSTAYSFMGSLQRAESPRPDGHACGAALVAPQWVVTVGHCVRNDQGALVGHPHGWKVRIGSTSVSSGGEIIEVDKFIRRPGDLQGNDIALLKLKTPAKGRPIKIAASKPTATTPVRILGWGMTCDELEPKCFPDHLREADTVVQTDASCEDAGIKGTEICVGSVDGKVAPTNMDSGGPAIARAGDGWTLVGAVSGGNPGQPGVYSAVPAFRTWMNDVMAEKQPTLDGAVDLDGCSGSLVKTDTAKPSDPALLLTNGHCVTGDRPAPKSAVVDRAEKRKVTVLDRAGKPKTTASTTKLSYATMTGTDVALYQLDKTYAQLASEGAKMFKLAATGPRQADPIDLIAGGLRKSWTCAVGGVVPELREEGYVLRNAIRYTEDCTPDSGGSGAPLINPHTGLVVGIHNTTNDQGGVCTEGNPCEVDKDGRMSVHKARRYGQQTAGIVPCLTAGSRIDLSSPKCALTKPVS
ncbi:trypsin-like serine protease [Streptomyces sp. NPDC007861]|uniref:trypsin-like serine protease n=1 Tax=Streptomyces sp. NPDC007861 TaxID=3154893 RepID=UPI003408324B